MAKLKVFISSTCYDLSVVRAELRPFLREMGHEPVMSEYNDVLYNPYTHTHQSCIDELVNCDIVLLIIGSRFGGECVPSVLNNIDIDSLKLTSASPEFLDKEEKISITQAEILKAIEKSIPIYTFIQDQVYSDHRLYEKNKNNLNVISKIDFPSIQKKDSAKYIFEFINFLRHRTENNSIVKFTKLVNIKTNLKEQLSHLLQRLLSEKNDPIPNDSLCNSSISANIQLVEGTDGYLNMLAGLIENARREVLFTSTRMAGTNEGGAYGTFQKLIIENSIKFQQRNPSRLHYGIIDAMSVETSSGAAELRSKVPDIVLRFNDELNSIKVNFFISDEEFVVFRMNRGGNKNRYSVLIQNKHLAIIIKRYFYSLWEKSKSMSSHLKDVIASNEHTLEDILDSSGHEKAWELIEFLNFLSEIDRKHQIIPSRFIEKVIHSKKSQIKGLCKPQNPGPHLF